MARSDGQFMRLALFLAEKRGLYAAPNPKVGAVLVKGGRILGQGAHERYGGPHAEVKALRRAGAKARGATLYVTLEPCSHQGKTPPCVSALLKAGVGKVVAAMKDPFPAVSGRGFQALRKAGVKVSVGLLEKQAADLNRDFLFSIRHGRPKVLLKAALSLDGKLAAPGQPRWITGKAARRRAHLLRSRCDAILVGSRTALADDPSLTVRLPRFKRRDGWPLRVLLDSRLRISLKAAIFRGAARTVVFCSRSASRRREKALSRRGIWVFRVPLLQKMLSLKAVLKVLHSLGVRSLMVEGGAEVHASFLREGLADEAALFLAPKTLGGDGPSWNLAETLPLLWDVRVEKVGDDFLLTGKIKGGFTAKHAKGAKK